ncbi:MAG: SGNH/GDSL hydrolase family protein [Tannerellaceae bacterium]|nr:SGNH/GDSL hydrolase family protein [Tannerellaceae bacterium]
MNNSRRNFFKKGVMAGVGGLLFPQVAGAIAEKQQATTNPGIKLSDNSIILFQGDSITDCNRDRNNGNFNAIEQLGNGYVLFIASQLLDKYASKQLKIYNRGISGNKVYQLRERWEQDCLALQLDVLSILIGVNDHWHSLSGEYKGTAADYERDYRELLTYTKEKQPAIQLVICEPFVVEGGASIEKEKWFPAFNEYRAIARRLADEFNAIFVPFQAAFDEALKKAPARYWAYDGVHPDLPARQLMADVWMKVTGLK